ncbi:altronate dehydratase family protein [Sphingomonas sp. BGYR3]|uniref:UxaA family hydrolase n=1 Tax=Sphingomonas sp. BGYR3 TaxID=2975483 RepID=UPI0021A6B605|nr:altronate dehydratase family protein [Sphingomonas sp. BGYR3]MDG5487802.1 altronate dehydratase family protein [Sphingomonas sp. BGYR3]
MTQMPALFHVDPRDDVGTALHDLAPGDVIDTLLVRQPVARGHKVAVRPVSAGSPVLKYGFPIGTAISDIAAGDHVHTHNLSTALTGSGDYAYDRKAETAQARGDERTFMGYARGDGWTGGLAGTRNEIWVIPTVGCVARTASKIAERGDARHRGKGVDGVHALTHPFGCSQLGDDLDGTAAILAALAQHPNAGGVLLIGLGCENNQLDALMGRIDPSAHPRIRTLRAQSAGDELAEGDALIDDLAAIAAKAHRSPQPLSALSIGVKCGGSDGLSGLTANPLVGRMSDRVTIAGGRVILTEIPEIFGAEHLLMQRADNEAVFDGIVDVVNGFKAYFTAHGEPVSENPSPGNVAGGITTLEEKSLGAVQKAGRAIVTDVIPYGARVTRPGLTLLEAPGNDAVSSTALTASGATIILFTTGRGTPLGFPAPTVKVASNTALAERKPGWIDFDAGRVLDCGMETVANDFLDKIVAIASGEQTAAERNDEREIAIWKRGVTL